MQTKTRLVRALEYARRGWGVLPCYGILRGKCACRSKSPCREPAHHSRVLGGVLAATTDEASIHDWWKKWPNANVALAAGKESGLVVLAENSRIGGAKTMACLERELGKLPDTMAIELGTTLRYRLFRYPKIGIASDPLGHVCGRGVFIISDRMTFLVPPSRMPSGERVRWVKGKNSADKLAVLSEKWVSRLTQPSRAIRPQKPTRPFPSRRPSPYGVVKTSTAKRVRKMR